MQGDGTLCSGLFMRTWREFSVYFQLLVLPVVYGFPIEAIVDDGLPVAFQKHCISLPVEV